MIDKLYTQLTKVNQLSLETISKTNPCQNGRAIADVSIQQLKKEELLYEEKGKWVLENKAVICFVNSFLWQKKSNKMRLSHCRGGLLHPVHLFDLVYHSEDSFYSVCPHYCGNDVYQAALVLKPFGILLNISVTGPKKENQLIYNYSS